MFDYVITIFRGQFQAGLAMLNECIVKCPEESWDGRIAKYPFWHVAYHLLCFVDCYLSPNEHAFKPGRFHPRGLQELQDEYPSRRFERAELLEYLAECRKKLDASLAAESRESLEGPSGFSWLPFSRGETHLYNIRHLQHHTGQLSAFLRRQSVDTRWVKVGWRDA